MSVVESSLPPPAPRTPDAASAVLPFVQVEDVTKTFGDVVAVSKVTFSVGSGVTALLGPNGAGKSTLFRMLCGLTAPSLGTVRVLGENARTNRDVRGRIGLAPQQDALLDRLTALEFVALAGESHGIAEPLLRASQCLEYVGLDAHDSKRVGAYSKGMRQRVKLAAALVNDPDLLILDEPLTGLDPLQRNRMIRLFHDLGNRGKCLLVSSHVLDEVARMGSKVLVIAQGRLVASGDYRRLRELMDDRPHRVRVLADDTRRLVAVLVSRALVDGVSVRGDTALIDTLDIDSFGRNIAVVAAELGVRLLEVVPTDDDLEAVFRYLVERR
ncbi:MAG: ABC transporter ATP-binding protein [Acidimicrobiia bacterium]|nr:ABC transporter ATP-binding protein [Acidimicrobiia bacterium]MCY4458693.1 ABC transporter ATP-binding protein [Acidimicrobiaceae bacterium]